MSRLLPWMALAAGAYASNPDEDSFQRYVENELKKDGSHWIERKVVAQLSKNLYPREDYYFFSLIKIPDEKVTYVGLFGNWVRWPPAFLNNPGVKPPPSSSS